MRTTRPERPAGAPRPSAELDGLIDRLERNLAGQLALVREEDFEALSQAADEAGGLLAEAGGGGGPLSAGQAERLSEIIQLHHQIGLILAEKRHEALQKLARSGRGRKLLKAYRQGR